MAKATDWAKEAATEIDEGCDLGKCRSRSIDQIQAIIEKHCPFKRDVLYEEVKEK